MLNRQQTIRKVINSVPGSARELARKAGVSHSLLSQVCSGKRNATPELIEALASVLEERAGQCADGAKLLRQLAKEDA